MKSLFRYFALAVSIFASSTTFAMDQESAGKEAAINFLSSIDNKDQADHTWAEDRESWQDIHTRSLGPDAVEEARRWSKFIGANSFKCWRTIYGHACELDGNRWTSDAEGFTVWNDDDGNARKVEIHPNMGVNCFYANIAFRKGSGYPHMYWTASQNETSH